jgi:hypothetical protein
MQNAAIPLLIALALHLIPNPAQATVFAEPDAEKLYYYPYAEESNGTLFQVGNNDISVTHLGIWDRDGDGLNLSYDVALFCWCNHTPLAQTIIPSGTTAPLESGSRWVSINPVQLQAGGYYVIAAYRPDSGDIYDSFTWLLNEEATWGPGITPLDDLYDVSSSLILPESEEAYDAIIGANFQYTIISTPDTGSTLALLSLGLLAISTPALRKTAPTSFRPPSTI